MVFKMRYCLFRRRRAQTRISLWQARWISLVTRVSLSVGVNLIGLRAVIWLELIGPSQLPWNAQSLAVARVASGLNVPALSDFSFGGKRRGPLGKACWALLTPVCLMLVFMVSGWSKPHNMTRLEVSTSSLAGVSINKVIVEKELFPVGRNGLPQLATYFQCRNEFYKVQPAMPYISQNTSHFHP